MTNRCSVVPLLKKGCYRNAIFFFEEKLKGTQCSEPAKSKADLSILKDQNPGDQGK